jgi:hypothetical protein
MEARLKKSDLSANPLGLTPQDAVLTWQYKTLVMLKEDFWKNDTLKN